MVNKKTGVKTALYICIKLYHASQVSVGKFRVFHWLGKSASGHRTDSGFVAAADVLFLNEAIIFSVPSLWFTLEVIPLSVLVLLYYCLPLS
jgi:hypothetical protein